MGPYTTIAEVDRIAQMPDPVLRNKQITRSYHDLSLEIAKRTGPCANWCTFATWASRQAGQSIRKEDLLHALEDHLGSVPSLGQSINHLIEGLLAKGSRLNKQAITKLVWETMDPKAAMDRASDAVARGNQKVYAEIGREFARFLETCANDNTYDVESINHFCSPLRSGDPPDGQRYLKQAFRRYYEAFFEPDDKRKAEMILTANIEIGFHEQTRLQPEIAEALETAVVDPAQFKDKLLTTLFPSQSWMQSLSWMFSSIFGKPSPVDAAADAFAMEARHRIRQFLSIRMMELDLPNRHMRLGYDLNTAFPSSLLHLSYPDLLELLKNIDPTPDSLNMTGAVDWADLHERLHFIADMFRCFQEEQALVFTPPG
ncbi:MAG: hypothetical protein IT270_11920 [Saprospiraceae bacterium]|nr:hypothetical protein [Saprospiraceae bacterium]